MLCCIASSDQSSLSFCVESMSCISVLLFSVNPVLLHSLFSFFFLLFFLFHFLLEPGDSKDSKTFAAVYDALRIADIVSSSSLRNITGAKIQAVKEVVGEVAFNQGMMATLGRTF